MAIPDLNGKLVLVTGAATGIGRATALAFARAGARLVLSDIAERPLLETLASVQACGASATAHVVDVTDSEAMQALAVMVLAGPGVPHVLVNNAGVAYLGSFEDTPVSAWRRVFDINLMGVVHGCQAFLPAMRDAGDARHVLNVASLAAVAPAPNMSAYAASKSAVLGLCDVLALELAGSRLRVSAVCPGVIDTPITASPTSAQFGAKQLERLRHYYRTKGAPPSVVADAMVEAVRRGGDLVLTGPMARSAYLVRCLSRALLRWVTLRDSRKAGYL